jgi:hypothetical protein
VPQCATAESLTHPVKRVQELLPWNVAGISVRLDQRDAA